MEEEDKNYNFVLPQESHKKAAIEWFWIDVQPPEFWDKAEFSSWIRQCIVGRGYSLGYLSFVFCDDSYLLDINKKYLNHDELTDIITFPLSENLSVIAGEIYISLPRIEENAASLAPSFHHEFLRVISHGCLHLLGFDDKNETQKAIMRKEEEQLIGLFAN